MLTIFSIPKAYIGHIGIIQRNALRSWVRLREDIEVILLGDEAGVAEAAREVGAVHVPYVQRNEYGTPLINSAFSSVARMANNPLLCYVNGDIMFTDELTRAVSSIRKRKFLMVGKRYNVQISEPWDFSDSQWSGRLLKFTRENGILYRDDAIDYFVFPRDSKLTVLLPFAVGRPRWDNYFLFRCRKLGYPLIDATSVVTAIHQNHDYSHVPQQTGYLWEGPEADANIRLLGDESRAFGLIDATHKLTESGLELITDSQHQERRRHTALVLHPWRKVVVAAGSILKSLLRRTGVSAILRRMGILPHTSR
jgi:hypothetical protein